MALIIKTYNNGLVGIQNDDSVSLICTKQSQAETVLVVAQQMIDNKVNCLFFDFMQSSDQFFEDLQSKKDLIKLINWSQIQYEFQFPAGYEQLDEMFKQVVHKQEMNMKEDTMNLIAQLLNKQPQQMSLLNQTMSFIPLNVVIKRVKNPPTLKDNTIYVGFYLDNLIIFDDQQLIHLMKANNKYSQVSAVMKAIQIFKYKQVFLVFYNEPLLLFLINNIDQFQLNENCQMKVYYEPNMQKLNQCIDQYITNLARTPNFQSYFEANNVDMHDNVSPIPQDLNQNETLLQRSIFIDQTRNSDIIQTSSRNVYNDLFATDEHSIIEKRISASNKVQELALAIQNKEAEKTKKQKEIHGKSVSSNEGFTQILEQKQQQQIQPKVIKAKQIKQQQVIQIPKVPEPKQPVEHEETEIIVSANPAMRSVSQAAAQKVIELDKKLSSIKNYQQFFKCDIMIQHTIVIKQINGKLLLTVNGGTMRPTSVSISESVFTLLIQVTEKLRNCAIKIIVNSKMLRDLVYEFNPERAQQQMFKTLLEQNQILIDLVLKEVIITIQPTVPADEKAKYLILTNNNDYVIDNILQKPLLINYVSDLFGSVYLQNLTFIISLVNFSTQQQLQNEVKLLFEQISVQYDLNLQVILVFQQQELEPEQPYELFLSNSENKVIQPEVDQFPSKEQFKGSKTLESYNFDKSKLESLNFEPKINQIIEQNKNEKQTEKNKDKLIIKFQCEVNPQDLAEIMSKLLGIAQGEFKVEVGGQK
ncbi:Hypothetical_protein [Hexamita inflata]|uniref:Hypothetical_protein n=1 Tax=Hexamita inflata TaxID=28002 RepID=A0AA86RVG6_9EUKA|nr:Hypothetical protein HINF_LOCUS60970 [Hexamita inflata]